MKAITIVIRYGYAGPMISIIPTELFWLAGAFIMLMACLLAATAE